MDPMLQTTDVTGGYGSVQILNGVSLQVGRGRMAALLGGNGTGKSTMLKVLSGLLRPWSGSIVFDGERIEGLRPGTNYSYRIVAARDEAPLSAGRLRTQPTRPDRATRARGLERSYEYFPILKERRRQLTGTLSGGQLQMLCIARGLMSEPKMMLLDEPSAALAPQVVMEIFRTIGRICRDGMTLLMVEQNVRMALLLVEYGYVIKDGVIHLEGPAEQMIDDDAVRMSYLGGTVADSDLKLAH